MTIPVIIMNGSKGEEDIVNASKKSPRLIKSTAKTAEIVNP